MIKIRFIFIIMLAVGLIYSGCARQEPSQPVVEESKEQVSAPEGEMVTMKEGGQESVSKKNLPFNMYGRDDPFALVDRESTALIKRKREGLNLEGIVFDSAQPLAMINDMIVKQGDTIEGKVVIKIGMQSVILEDEYGRKSILRLF